METKLCTKCREVLPLEAFSTKRNSETKLAARCDRCRSASAVQWNARNPERMRLAGARFIAPGQARASRLRRTHGINPGDYQRLLVAQQHRCAICRRDSKQGRWSCLHVDHDHE